MKKILYITIFIILLTQCKKHSTNENMKPEKNIEAYNENPELKIDINQVNKLVKESTNLNLNVFIAISILHKDFISKYSEEVNGLSEDEQKKFYLDKKKVFFNSIKYSEDEYNNFMMNNINEINQYISSHKSVEEFLIGY